MNPESNTYMRKVIIILGILLLTSANCIIAQTKRYFCEIKGTEKLNSKMKIVFDFGDIPNYKLKSKMQIVDEKGNPIEFNSMVDAMNYMSERGWNFLQAYSTYLMNVPAMEHWILYKDATSKEEARKGILTKEDFEK